MGKRPLTNVRLSRGERNDEDFSDRHSLNHDDGTGLSQPPAANNRTELQADAKAAFEIEMRREAAGDCQGAQTTFDANLCYYNQNQESERNLRKLETALRSLLLSAGVPAPMTGPGGRMLSGNELASEFDRSEQSWRAYLQSAVDPGHHQLAGGTGGPAFSDKVRLLLVRNHMRELEAIYWLPLTK